MNSFKWRLSQFVIVIFFLSCISCDKPLPKLEGIDLQGWQADKNGCRNVRLGMQTAIEKEKDKLLSLDQMQIIQLLGRPDQNELLKCNQKFFFYFIQPSNLCERDSVENPTRLVIRFNAVGLAKEIMIE